MAPQSQRPSPVVQHLASRPCRLCGGTEFSWFPHVGFEQVAGSSQHSFEVLACRACHHTDLFVALGELERLNAHAVLRVPESPPFR
ncbi:MAG: hypothetical protein H6719_37280 [Sandaracinaceae bacterium]|nr:hypothetical protein [Sandaracinaceae bacterium]